MDAQRVTLDTYARIGSNRNSSHSNCEFWRQEFETFSTLVPSGTVLDIGCGAGRDAQLFVPNGYQYVGCDASSEMLKAARNLVPEGTFERVDLHNLPHANEHFDGIWSPATYLHIPKKDIVSTLSEACRVLRKSGYGYFMMKEGEGEAFLDGPFGQRFFAFYTMNEFARAITKAGFIVLSQAAAFNSLDPDRKHKYTRYFVQKNN